MGRSLPIGAGLFAARAQAQTGISQDAPEGLLAKSVLDQHCQAHKAQFAVLGLFVRLYGPADIELDSLPLLTDF